MESHALYRRIEVEARTVTGSRGRRFAIDRRGVCELSLGGDGRARVAHVVGCRAPHPSIVSRLGPGEVQQKARDRLRDFDLRDLGVVEASAGDARFGDEDSNVPRQRRRELERVPHPLGNRELDSPADDRPVGVVAANLNHQIPGEEKSRRPREEVDLLDALKGAEIERDELVSLHGNPERRPIAREAPIGHLRAGLGDRSLRGGRYRRGGQLRRVSSGNGEIGHRRRGKRIRRSHRHRSPAIDERDVSKLVDRFDREVVGLLAREPRHRVSFDRGLRAGRGPDHGHRCPEVRVGDGSGGAPDIVARCIADVAVVTAWLPRKVGAITGRYRGRESLHSRRRGPRSRYGDHVRQQRNVRRLVPRFHREVDPALARESREDSGLLRSRARRRPAGEGRCGSEIGSGDHVWRPSQVVGARGSGIPVVAGRRPFERHRGPFVRFDELDLSELSLVLSRDPPGFRDQELHVASRRFGQSVMDPGAGDRRSRNAENRREGRVVGAHLDLIIQGKQERRRGPREEAHLAQLLRRAEVPRDELRNDTRAQRRRPVTPGSVIHGLRHLHTRSARVRGRDGPRRHGSCPR